MEQREIACRGCLLGLAVGDAMGYTVDKKSWAEICQDYGPNGLLGYDLANGYAEITSYTQLAAFACNSLLLGVTRGNQEKYGNYIALGLREWLKGQQYRGGEEKTFCWLVRVPEMRHRHCMDTRILDALSRETLGTPENPIFKSDNPGAITIPIAVGLLYDKAWMAPSLVGKLGTQAVAFTHGNKESFLAGAVLAYAIAGIVQHPDKPLALQFSQAVQAMQTQFGETYGEAETVARLMFRAMEFAKDSQLNALAAMSMLECTTAAECLAGAMYACLIHPANFDEAVIAAVNHSGRSAAVGALTGAILGAKLGVEALPDFYLECLEPASVLGELAEDVAQGRQVMQLFDDNWDQKYAQGRPVNR